MALHNATKVKRSGAKKPQARKSADRPRGAAEAVVDRSAAVAKSWKNKDVAAARSVKHKVKVAGVEYRSVLAAFEALKLDVNKHIGFRAELKASESGRKTFTDEKGNKHQFALVAAAAA